MTKLLKHPLGALYGTLLGLVALFAAVPMVRSAMWEAALVDVVMAGVLIVIMVKKFTVFSRRQSTPAEKCVAWGLLIIANILALLPGGEFPGSLNTAFAFSLLICAFVLFFSGTPIAASGVVPTLWCCVFMPYHEEFMLLLSFPLRLSATMLSAWILKLCGVGIIYSGTLLQLSGLDIAITDACSGINQLDAFILIAFIAAQMMHKKIGWRILHFAFIMPSIIIGNSLRIVLTIVLFKLLGERVLMNTWHIALGYVQIVFAMLIFLAIGKIFRAAGQGSEEEKSC